MQTSYLRLRTWTLWLAAILWWLSCAGRAAESRTNTPARSPSPSPGAAKAALAEPEIPKSVFNIPTSPQEGKDPFYPLSTRLFAHAVVVPTIQPAAVLVVELQLKALSGTPGHRFAIINNHTFETGEEGDVMTNAGRAHVRCLEIKEDAVLVQIGGQQRVLHLRPGI